MLNRTNRTLSASFNRLNLGTRSLDLIASAFNGEQTLRTRHAHAVVLRDGMVGDPGVPMPIGMRRPPISVIPCSPVVVPQPSVSCVIPARVELAPQPSSSTPHWRQCGKHNRKSFTGKRLYPGREFASASGRAAWTAAAATFAAAGG
jgi:hypothetical protein